MFETLVFEKIFTSLETKSDFKYHGKSMFTQTDSEIWILFQIENQMKEENVKKV